MRRTWVYIDGQAYEKGAEPPPSERREAPEILPDITPYRSMIDGRMINSRSAHREHLRAHGCIEIGNESLPPAQMPLDVAPEKRKELIRAQVESMTQAQFKRALALDIEYIKWNSRK